MLVSLGQGRLFVHVLGVAESPEARGFRVVALHGWQRSGDDFISSFSDFPYKVLAPDLPGFGRSPEPPTALSPGGYAELLDALIGRPEEKVVIVGHSFGGRVAVHLARLWAEKVRSLVLVAVPLLSLSSKRQSRLYRALRGAARIGLVREATLERARRRFGSRDYASASPLMRKVLSLAVDESRAGIYPEVVSSLNCRIVLMWGDADTEVPIEVARAFVEKLPVGAEVELVRGAGHFVHLNHPERLKHLVLKELSMR